MDVGDVINGWRIVVVSRKVGSTGPIVLTAGATDLDSASVVFGLGKN